MPRVPAYEPNQVALRPLARVPQQDVNDGGGQAITSAVSRLGQRVAGVAEMQEKRLADLDEAEALEIDNGFAEWSREALRGENGFLNQQGQNALNARDPLVAQFDQQAQAALARTQGARQQGLVRQALIARRASFMDNVDAHAGRETETYRVGQFNAWTAQTALDLAAQPDTEERMPQFMALREGIRTEGQRQGWSAEQTQAAFLESLTNVHTGWIQNSLATGNDPHAAEAYLEKWGGQIEGTKRTQLQATVRNEVYEFDAFRVVEGLPDRSPATATVAETPDGPVTLHPPVAAGALSSPFGQRAAGNHRGIDLAVPVHTPVVASAPGVIRWRNDPDGYGRYAVIDHGGGLETRYAHMSEADVPEGSRVDAGTVIGLSGGARGAEGAGNSRGPHVHYEVRRNGVAVDPQGALSGEAAPRSEHAADVQPASLESAYEQAAEIAERDRPGDWRYARVVQRAMVERYGRTQQVEADRERQAADEVAPYLPGGASAAARYEDIPVSIRGRLSPQQDLSIRNTFIREAEGGVTTNGEVQNSLLDLAYYDKARFNSLDLNAYSGSLSRSDMDSLRQRQRTTRTESPNATSPVDRALQGTDTIINRFLETAGFETGEGATVEDIRTRGQLRQRVADGVSAWIASHNGQPPTQSDIINMTTIMMRQVETQVDGRTERVRAFQANSGEIRTVIPSGDRRDIERRLRTAGLPVNSENRDRFYRRGLAEGLYQPPGD